MSSDETPKIEPTLTDAPSIAPEIKPEAIKSEIAEGPKVEAPKAEAPEITIEAKAEPAKIEPKLEAKPETNAEAPTLPPAPQIEPATAIILRRPQPKTENSSAQRSTSRFALLAASVAIAASFGAIGGSLGVAKFGYLFTPQAEPVAVAATNPTTDDIKAVKDSITQLRAQTKSLNDNLASLKTTVTTTTAMANQQNSKITETLDRIEKAQAEQRKLMAAQAAPETTGSISTTTQKQAAAVPMVLGDPPTTLKPPILQDFVLRRVYDGAALIEGRHGVIEVEPGVIAPGIGRIEAIKRQDGRWVVVTARGLIVQR
jgi:hypothetical protein